MVRLSFAQKLTSHDYFYDYTDAAQDRDPANSIARLYLGPLSPYTQVAVDARQSIVPRLSVGGAVWIRHLNDSGKQGPFETSFEDYRVSAQIFPARKLETDFEYHQRNSDRLPPGPIGLFDDIQQSGETSIKDLVGQVRRSFGEGRVSLSGGAYYRRIDMQDRFFFIKGAHQTGWLAGAWLRLDQKTRLFFDYSLDNDYFIFRPSIANAQVLRVGMAWKY